MFKHPKLNIMIGNTIYSITIWNELYNIDQTNKWTPDSVISFQITEFCLKELLLLDFKYHKNKDYQFTIFFMVNDEENCIFLNQNDCKCGLLENHECNIDDFEILLEKIIYMQKHIYI